jgi:hypothetical protein
MSIEPKSINERWDRIRRKEECDLSLTPESVAEYLSIPESELVRARIRESLIQFANYRVKSGDKGFISRKPASPGEMATCEGLEAFFVPAVEGALSFSAFLDEYNRRGKEKERFLELINKDILGLVAEWEKSRFSGQPYANTDDIYDAIVPIKRDEFKSINITEAAAMACRVVIHLLTLKLNRPEEELFQREISKELHDDRLFAALTNAIDFLVRSFQKGEGGSEETRIANASTGGSVGSGWSWTDRPGLPPMLFFSAAAVDAFAELDLYLIRAVLKDQLVRGEGGSKLRAFYEKNQQKLIQLQLCVDMARRWVQKAVLPDLSVGYGQHVEKFYQDANSPGEELKYDKSPEGYEHFKEDLARLEKLQHPPMVFYNGLYALSILLWSWGDWSDDGMHADDEAKSGINRALAQLVYNYGSIPVVKEILNRFPYVFNLPGKGIFQPSELSKTAYLDSAFLPLLTRLLVLFVVYGVGDRNLLEPVIRDLYVELLQNRHRGNLDYSALWSTDYIEVFSTQRAIQSLTFYYAYARGKEMVEGKGKLSEIITLRNKTGFPLILEAVSERPAGLAAESSNGRAIAAKDWVEYCREQIPGWNYVLDENQDKDADDFQGDAKDLGNEILGAYHKGEINAEASRTILNSLISVHDKPKTGVAIRKSELTLLRHQFVDACGRSKASSE